MIIRRVSLCFTTKVYVEVWGCEFKDSQTLQIQYVGK